MAHDCEDCRGFDSPAACSVQTTEARRRTFPALLWHLDRLHVSRQQSSEKKTNKALKHVKEPTTAAISKAPRASGRGRSSNCSTRGIQTLRRLNVGLERRSTANVCAPLSEIPIRNISTPDNAEHGLHSGYCWIEYRAGGLRATYFARI